jgi:hypothetical protein
MSYLGSQLQEVHITSSVCAHIQDAISNLDTVKLDELHKCMHVNVSEPIQVPKRRL